MSKYGRYIRSLAYAADPDYDHMNKLFKSGAIELGLQLDNVFDWSET